MKHVTIVFAIFTAGILPVVSGSSIQLLEAKRHKLLRLEERIGACAKSTDQNYEILADLFQRDAAEPEELWNKQTWSARIFAIEDLDLSLRIWGSVKSTRSGGCKLPAIGKYQQVKYDIKRKQLYELHGKTAYCESMTLDGELRPKLSQTIERDIEFGSQIWRAAVSEQRKEFALNLVKDLVKYWSAAARDNCEELEKVLL